MNKKQVEIEVVGLNGVHTKSKSGRGLCDAAIKYTELYKREVLVLKYFFDLFTLGKIKMSFPEDFEIFLQSCSTDNNKNFFHFFRITWKRKRGPCYLWIVIKVDNNGRCSVFARSKFQYGVWKVIQGEDSPQKNTGIRWVIE